MIPVIGVTGKSGVGKTTLMVRLIEEFRSRGLEVGVIKHTTHHVDIDQEGKDTNLMHQAGANVVGLASNQKVAVYMDTEEPWPPDEIAAKLFPRVDILLVEGFGDAPIPRIGLVRKGVAEEPLEKKGYIAFVSDLEIETELPVFGFGEVPKIVDLLDDYVRRLGPRRDVKLFVNGKKVFMKPFIKDFFLNTISAMVDSLRGTATAERISILIDKPGGEPREED